MQSDEKTLKPLFWRNTQKDTMDSQSTYYSQPMNFMEYSQPFRDINRRMEGGAAVSGLGGLTSGTSFASQELISQDSGLGMSSSSYVPKQQQHQQQQQQQQLPPPSVAPPRTKSELLERRISSECLQRKQLERDVRQALTHVATHVTALPDKWQQVCGQLAAASDGQCRRSEQQLAEVAGRIVDSVHQLTSSVADSLTQQKQVVGELCQCASRVDTSVDGVSRALVDTVKSMSQRVDSSLALYSEQLERTVRTARDLHVSAVSQLRSISSQLQLLTAELPAQLRSMMECAASQLTHQLLKQLQASEPNRVFGQSNKIRSSSPPGHHFAEQLDGSKSRTSGGRCALSKRHSPGQDSNVYDFNWDDKLGWLSPLSCVRVSTTITSVSRPRKRVAPVSPATPTAAAVGVGVGRSGAQRLGHRAGGAVSGRGGAAAASVMGTPLVRSVSRSLLTSSSSVLRQHSPSRSQLTLSSSRAQGQQQQQQQKLPQRKQQQRPKRRRRQRYGHYTRPAGSNLRRH